MYQYIIINWNIARYIYHIVHIVMPMIHIGTMIWIMITPYVNYSYANSALVSARLRALRST